MKKISFYLIALLIGVSTVFTSCSKDDDILDPNPTIDFKGGGEYVANDVTIKAGESIKVGVNAAYNSQTKKKLTKFNIILTANNTPTTLIDETLTSNQESVYSQDFMITFPNVGVVKLVARITDSDNKTDEVEFTVTVEQAGVEVKKKTNVEFGSFNDPIGSFYASSTEEVFTVSQAAANQAKVDLVFFKGVTNGNTIAAPDDTDANGITDFNLNTWTTKNQTRFIKTTMTAAEFDAIGTVYNFPEFVAANGLTKANQLANGNVIYFRTQAGKRGYAKVVDLYTKGDKAKFDFIIEK
jgi:hypothetical protein